MIKTAVVGAGHMGMAHARVLDASPHAELVAICDTDPEKGLPISKKHGVPFLNDHRQLPGLVQAAHVCVPTDRHYEVSVDLAGAGISLLVEKPITDRFSDGEELVRLAGEKGVVLQVGHVERFNPAARKLAAELKEPRYLEIHRLAAFKNRGIEVSVVADLMIHDLDLVLDLVSSPVRKVVAMGISAFTSRPDIATARIAFENGTVANLTASRISDKSLRKVRVFENDCYWSLDCEHRRLICYHKNPSEAWKAKKSPELGDLIIRREIQVPDHDPLESEITSFLQAVSRGTEPEVTGRDGLRALRLAEMIEESIKKPGSEIGPAGNGVQ